VREICSRRGPEAVPSALQAAAGAEGAGGPNKGPVGSTARLGEPSPRSGGRGLAPRGRGLASGTEGRGGGAGGPEAGRTREGRGRGERAALSRGLHRTASGRLQAAPSEAGPWGGGRRERCCWRCCCTDGCSR
jgi:hypothetical protein